MFPSSSLEVGVLVTAVTVTFQFYCKFLYKYVNVPKSVREREKIDTWWNTFVSLTHSALSSCMLIYAWYVDIDFVSDLENHFSTATVLASVFSFGYFIHDTIHMFSYRAMKNDLGMVLHHTIMLLSLGKCLHNMRYVNVLSVALFCEISSVFLHIRLLVKMSGIAEKREKLFNMICFLNIVVYVLVRFGVIIWLYRWLYDNYETMELSYFLTYSILLTLMTCVNVVYFGILLHKDFIQSYFSKSNIKESWKQNFFFLFNLFYFIIMWFLDCSFFCFIKVF